MTICIATPCHRGSDEALGAIANWSAALVQALKLEGAQLALVSNCPWLDAARADLVAAFLNTSCTHILFRDDDIFFEPDVLRRMLDAKAPIIVAPYRIRLPPHTWATGGLGAALIRRDVIEALRDQHPELRYYQEGEERCGLFHHMFVGQSTERRLLKEDHAFFHRVRGAGYSVVECAGARVRHGDVES
jgi:hypothetical protein